MVAFTATQQQHQHTAKPYSDHFQSLWPTEMSKMHRNVSSRAPHHQNFLHLSWLLIATTGFCWHLGKRHDHHQTQPLHVLALNGKRQKAHWGAIRYPKNVLGIHSKPETLLTNLAQVTYRNEERYIYICNMETCGNMYLYTGKGTSISEYISKSVYQYTGVSVLS